MFGLGTWELVLVLVVAVLFLGPDKLPELAKTLGKSVRSIQKAMGGVDATMRPVQNAARKLNESIDRAVDLDGTYADNEAAEPDHAPTEDNPTSETETEDLANAPIAAANPFAPVAPEESSEPPVEPDTTSEAASDASSDESAKDESST